MFVTLWQDNLTLSPMASWYINKPFHIYQSDIFKHRKLVYNCYQKNAYRMKELIYLSPFLFHALILYVKSSATLSIMSDSRLANQRERY